jgi:hypothetical protein
MVTEDAETDAIPQKRREIDAGKRKDSSSKGSSRHISGMELGRLGEKPNARILASPIDYRAPRPPPAPRPQRQSLEWVAPDAHHNATLAASAC